MTVRSDITQEAGWVRYESKEFDITVTDVNNAAVDLSAATALRVVLLRERGASPPLLRKTTGNGLTIVGAGDNVVRVAVNYDEYDNIRSNIWAYELWDDELHLQLTWGDAWLSPGSAPARLVTVPVVSLSLTAFAPTVTA